MTIKPQIESADEQEFKKWQCICRQTAMRENMGRPDASFTPLLFLHDDDEAFTQIITIMNKSPKYSETAEMLHIARKTKDPSEIRENGLKYFSATFYQKADQFSSILTATFPPGSHGAKAIRDAQYCRLVFEAYTRKYSLSCRVWNLSEKSVYRQSTLAHNSIFNPQIPSDTIVLGFEPIWENSYLER